MMKTRCLQIFMSVLCLATISVSAVTRNPKSIKKRSATPALTAETSKSKVVVFGGIDLRPSISSSDGALSTENSLELGLKFGDNVKLSYIQEIESADTEKEGHQVSIADGFLRAKFSNLWKSSQYNLSFSDQVRVYLPTVAAKRDAGMIATVRNYLSFNMQITENLSFDISEVPILHLYNEAGYVEKNKFTANPSFENRFILGPTINFTKDFSLGIPLHFYVKKFRNYDRRAANNESESLDLWINPEFNYNLNDNFYMGAGYRTNNFIGTDEVSNSVLADGVGTGVFQVIFGVSF